jgi:signal transduction histidine kinase
LLAGESNLSIEVRLKRLYRPPSGNAEPARVLCHSTCRIEEGEVKSVMTIITDVSAFRWAEASEARRATQAEEAKRLQEEFIDFVSHELRNPLSAIFQLAETILTSFPTTDNSVTASKDALTEALRSNIDNAATILLCAYFPTFYSFLFCPPKCSYRPRSLMNNSC